MDEELTRCLTELSQQVGVLMGKMERILTKLDTMEKKYNGYSERTVRIEEDISNLKKLLNKHLHDHEQEKSWKMQIKAAILGGVAGSMAGGIITLFMLIFKGV